MEEINDKIEQLLKKTFEKYLTNKTYKESKQNR